MSHGEIFKEEYTKDLFPETIESVLHKFIEWLKAYNLYELYTEKWKCKYQEANMETTGTLEEINIDYKTGKPKISFLINDKNKLHTIEELKGINLKIIAKKYI